MSLFIRGAWIEIENVVVLNDGIGRSSYEERGLKSFHIGSEVSQIVAPHMQKDGTIAQLADIVCKTKVTNTVDLISKSEVRTLLFNDYE